MLEHHVTDWDDAYANFPNVAGSDRWPADWSKAAEAFRATRMDLTRLDIPYGTGERNRFDIFLPDATPAGLVVFIHGGYWRAFDKSMWSHLAAGALGRGYAVAIPGYTLCPQARISDIGREVSAAIEVAARMVEGPIALAGHSAGGHLASRMICAPSPLSPAVAARIHNVVSISGLHDLRPLMRLALNETLRIDVAEAASDSPALLEPMAGARITCWVGGNERHEFLRHSALLANIWQGLGATTSCVVEPDRNHFTVVEGLTDPDHALTRTLLS